MKKIAEKIAMILVLIMLANSFTSCFTVAAIKNGEPAWLILTIPLDIITFPLQLLGLAIFGDDIFDILASGEMETQIYLANTEYSSLPDYYSLREKICSLSEAELASLVRTFNSIPEKERNASMERLISLPEEKLVSLVRTYNSLPEREIVSSIERMNSLPDTELVSLLRTFNSLSGEELDTLVKEFNSRTETENVALADNFITLPETNIVSLKNDLQYYNVDMRLCFQ